MSPEYRAGPRTAPERTGQGRRGLRGYRTGRDRGESRVVTGYRRDLTGFGGGVWGWGWDRGPRPGLTVLPTSTGGDSVPSGTPPSPPNPVPLKCSGQLVCSVHPDRHQPRPQTSRALLGPDVDPKISVGRGTEFEVLPTSVPACGHVSVLRPSRGLGTPTVESSHPSTGSSSVSPTLPRVPLPSL